MTMNRIFQEKGGEKRKLSLYSMLTFQHLQILQHPQHLESEEAVK